MPAAVTVVVTAAAAAVVVVAVAVADMAFGFRRAIELGPLITENRSLSGLCMRDEGIIEVDEGCEKTGERHEVSSKKPCMGEVGGEGEVSGRSVRSEISENWLEKSSE